MNKVKLIRLRFNTSGWILEFLKEWTVELLIIAYIVKYSEKREKEELARNGVIRYRYDC